MGAPRHRATQPPVITGAENGINTPGFVARKKKGRIGKKPGNTPSTPRSPLGDVNNFSNPNPGRDSPQHNYSNLNHSFQSPAIGFDYARSPLSISASVANTPVTANQRGNTSVGVAASAVTPRTGGMRRSPSYSAAISHHNPLPHVSSADRNAAAPQHTELSDAPEATASQDSIALVIRDTQGASVEATATPAHGNPAVVDGERDAAERAVRDPKLDNGIPDWKRRLPSYLQMEP